MLYRKRRKNNPTHLVSKGKRLESLNMVNLWLGFFNSQVNLSNSNLHHNNSDNREQHHLKQTKATVTLNTVLLLLTWKQLLLDKTL
jgi:hypothetical protein